VSPALLWVPLAASTALGAWFISRHGPHDERTVDLEDAGGIRVVESEPVT